MSFAVVSRNFIKLTADAVRRRLGTTGEITFNELPGEIRKIVVPVRKIPYEDTFYWTDEDTNQKYYSPRAGSGTIVKAYKVGDAKNGINIPGSIRVTVKPKLFYYCTQENPTAALDYTDMVVKAIYGDGSKEEITDYTVSPAAGTIITPEQGYQIITVSWKYLGREWTTRFVVGIMMAGDNVVVNSDNCMGVSSALRDVAGKYGVWCPYEWPCAIDNLDKEYIEYARIEEEVPEDPTPLYIRITHLPWNTSYTIKDGSASAKVNHAGLEVTLYYEDGSSRVVTNECFIAPGTGNYVTRSDAGMHNVDIEYTDWEVTGNIFTTSFQIYVLDKNDDAPKVDDYWYTWTNPPIWEEKKKEWVDPPKYDEETKTWIDPPHINDSFIVYPGYSHDFTDEWGDEWETPVALLELNVTENGLYMAPDQAYYIKITVNVGSCYPIYEYSWTGTAMEKGAPAYLLNGSTVPFTSDLTGIPDGTFWHFGTSNGDGSYTGQELIYRGPAGANLSSGDTVYVAKSGGAIMPANNEFGALTDDKYWLGYVRDSAAAGQDTVCYILWGGAKI